MSELAEGARLEIACTTIKWYRGFESLSLRHFYFTANISYGLCFLFLILTPVLLTRSSTSRLLVAINYQIYTHWEKRLELKNRMGLK